MVVASLGVHNHNYANSHITVKEPLSQVFLSHHWKATTEYTKTKHILYVQKLPSHKNLNTTLPYTQLIALPQNEEYVCNVAKNVEGGPCSSMDHHPSGDLSGKRLFFVEFTIEISFILIIIPWLILAKAYDTHRGRD